MKIIGYSCIDWSNTLKNELTFNKNKRHLKGQKREYETLKQIENIRYMLT